MAEIVFKTIWQSDELSQLQKSNQEQSRCRGDMPGASLEHERKEKKWLFTKKKKSVSFHGTECNKIIDEAQLSCPELRRSAASTNVSALNLSCDKDSDSGESWASRKLQSPLAGTEDLKALWSMRQLNGSPCANFLESIERRGNAASVLRDSTQKLQRKSKDFEKHMAEVENNIMRQKSLTIEEKLINLCQKIKKNNMQWQDSLVRESEDRIAGTSEWKVGRQFGPGSPQVQTMEQIARSMSDLRQVLASQLNEMKVMGNPAGTSTGFEGKVPKDTSLLVDNVSESLENVADSYQSKASLQQNELTTLCQFHGKFEALHLQWERMQQEHQRTTQMLRELKKEIDSIANTSKKMFSAFDQIQKNIHNLGHIKPLIENIQKLLERRKSQRNTKPGYLSFTNQGEVLQQLVDQAVLPLVERIRRCQRITGCSECSGKSKHKLIVP
ncbi:testis-specific serine kinase substrate-like [Pristis pectinata]|uniref:testis-specific serine kinase substrate-like n=1 Tax=Pristis pectinata TaxID=685728 RepID=UPI00223CFE34|nr:testis-specific serine kinase substrate-like [Pristis pectinata]